MYFNNLMVFSFFCTFRAPGFPKRCQSTKSITWNKILSNTRSSTNWISLMWTPWNWLALSLSILLLRSLKIFKASSSCRWFQCKRRASAQKRHKLSLYGFPAISLKVGHKIRWFLFRGLCKTASPQPIGASLSETAKTVKFFNLWNLHIVFIFFLLQDSMKSVLFGLSSSFAKLSLVHTKLDRSNRVLSS